MLTRALYRYLTEDWTERWLRANLPRKYQQAQLDQDGNIVFTFEKQEPIIWDSGRCVKLLQRTEPDIAVELLYRVNRIYDERQETSELLRHKTAELLGCAAEPAFFYWSVGADGIVTTVALAGEPQHSDVVRLLSSGSDDAVDLVLPPTVWLRDVLIEHLVSRL